MRDAHAHVRYDPDKKKWVTDTCLKCRIKLTQNASGALARTLNDKSVEDKK